MKEAAVGFRVHSGWTAAVAVTVVRALDDLTALATVRVAGLRFIAWTIGSIFAARVGSFFARRLARL